MTEHHLIDAYAITVTELTAPNGTPLPVLELQFMTRTDPDSQELLQWPSLRLRPRDVEELRERLAEALRRAEQRDYSGPGRAQ